MANQHAPSPLFEIVCAREGCDNTSFRTAAKIKRSKNIYCSRSCARRYTRECKTYTEEVLQYVIDNVRADGFEKVAQHIGVTNGALRRQISKWRIDGIEIPYLRKGIHVEPVPKKKKVVHILAPKVIKPVKEVKPEKTRSNPADDLPNMLKLPGTKSIFIAEHSREVVSAVRRDSRTIVLKHKTV